MREQNSQNKQCRIPCLPFLSFLRILLALLKINGAANKSEFLVQPKSIFCSLTETPRCYSTLDCWPRSGDLARCMHCCTTAHNHLTSGPSTHASVPRLSVVVVVLPRVLPRGPLPFLLSSPLGTLVVFFFVFVFFFFFKCHNLIVSFTAAACKTEPLHITGTLHCCCIKPPSP